MSVTVLFTTFSLMGALVAGGNLSIVATRSGGAINWVSMVVAGVASVYFAARSHGWAP